MWDSSETPKCLEWPCFLITAPFYVRKMSYSRVQKNGDPARLGIAIFPEHGFSISGSGKIVIPRGGGVSIFLDPAVARFADRKGRGN